MCRLFSVAQTSWTSTLSQVPSPVAKFSKHPIPTNAMNGQYRDDDGYYEKSEEEDILVVKAE